MQYNKIRLERHGAVALLTLDNPAQMNAVDQDMGPQLAHALQSVAADGDLRALVLTGAGDIFCAGGNLRRAMQALAAGPTAGAGHVFLAYTAWVHQAVHLLLTMPQVVVAAVNGPTAGAGLAWLLASDLAVADENARIRPGFLGVGLTPAGGVTHLLPQALGPGRAAQALMQNQDIDPRHALALGLLNAVSPPGQALDMAMAMARQAAAGPAAALARTKALLGRQRRQGLLEQMEQERQATATAADGPDFRRLVAKFFHKQPASIGE